MHDGDETRTEWERVWAGARVAAPIGAAVFAVGVSFGVVARPLLGEVATIAMSAIVFAGSAQFAAVAVLGGGGGPAAAILAGILLNGRFIPMGIAVGGSLKGGRLRRAVEGQAVVDASWALANRGGGRFDRERLLGSTLVQYPAWLLGTVIGVYSGQFVGDPERLGLDALFPAFFLVLLVAELRASRRAAVAAAVGIALALALTPLVPAGIPVLLASTAALIGLRRP